LSRRWVEERRRDVYWRMAKKMGYRSRAAFKLIQMDEKYHVFDGVKRVVDLGAAPGGWLQVAAEAVGSDGVVVGVDLKPIEPLDLPNVRTIVGDITPGPPSGRLRSSSGLVETPFSSSSRGLRFPGSSGRSGRGSSS